MSQEPRSGSSTNPAHGKSHGREADHPREIPIRGWKDILARVFRDTGSKNLSLVAGGVTYYMLLALFPALASLVSLYGLVADPAQAAKTVDALSRLMPHAALQLIGTELDHLVSASSRVLSAGAVIGLVVSLAMSSYGVSGMISALNIAYGEEDKRSIFRFYLLTLIMTIGLVISGLVVLFLIAVLPVILTHIGISATLKWAALVVEAILVLVFMTGALAVLYRFAPDRQEARWEWISPGAITAMLLWGIASLLFTLYVGYFDSYDRTYGALGAVVVLLTWLWLSCYVVLLGAEINAEAERQTKRDSTTGAPEPMGSRGAFAADTLGKTREGT